MGDFKKNPEKPFEVRVPNKIRKRIAMHEKKPPITSAVEIMKRRYGIGDTSIKSPKKRDSMWSRFTNRIEKFLK